MAEYLYFDGCCGISGDMVVASLLDLGGSRDKLQQALDSLHLDGVSCSVERKASYSISGMDFDVQLAHEECGHEEHYHDHHGHRHLADVYDIIDRGNLTDKARSLAKKIFEIIAKAEAKAHGVSVEEVHFHEVGAIDSIIDIVSAAVLIDDLGVDKFIVTGLSEGSGTVTCQHGELPVPVPAVVNIAEQHGIVLRQTSTRGEMVTPTGIAIAAALQTQNKLPASYKIIKSGIGLGKKDFGRANFLRTMLIEDAVDDGVMYVLESNIDDSTAEQLGFAMEKIFAAGAADVHFEPCYMKKNRPAYILRVIVSATHMAETEYAIFRHTTTIGLRKYPVERTCMQRQKVMVRLPQGEVEVKISTYKDIVRVQPEYESVKKLAEQTGEDFYVVFNQAQSVAMNKLR